MALKPLSKKEAARQRALLQQIKDGNQFQHAGHSYYLAKPDGTLTLMRVAEPFHEGIGTAKIGKAGLTIVALLDAISFTGVMPYAECVALEGDTEVTPAAVEAVETAKLEGGSFAVIS